MSSAIKYEPIGNHVNVNGHRIHTYCAGQGEETLVFLAGAGTSCPTHYFNSLWWILSDYVSTFKNGKCVMLDCGHYVHP